MMFTYLPACSRVFLMFTRGRMRKTPRYLVFRFFKKKKKKPQIVSLRILNKEEFVILIMCCLFVLIFLFQQNRQYIS